MITAIRQRNIGKPTPKPTEAAPANPLLTNQGAISVVLGQLQEKLVEACMKQTYGRVLVELNMTPAGIESCEILTGDREKFI